MAHASHKNSQFPKANRIINSALFWPVNSNLHLRGSSYRLSKTAHNAGNFSQTIELYYTIYSFIYLFICLFIFDFSARSCKSLPCIIRQKYETRDNIMAQVKIIHISIIEVNE